MSSGSKSFSSAIQSGFVGFDDVTFVFCAKITTPPVTIIPIDLHIYNRAGPIWGGADSIFSTYSDPSSNRILANLWHDQTSYSVVPVSVPNGGDEYFVQTVVLSSSDVEAFASYITDTVNLSGVVATPIPYVPIQPTSSDSGIFLNNGIDLVGYLFIDRKLTIPEIEQTAQWFLDYARPPFNPDNLFGVDDRGGVFDVNDMSRYYQDPDGLVPITALGQAVLSFRPRNNDDLYVVADSSGDWIYTQDVNGFRCLSYINPASGVYSKAAEHLFTDGLFNSGTFVGTSAGQVEEFATPFFGANCGIYAYDYTDGLYAYGGTSVAGGEVYASISVYGDTQSTPIPPEIPVDGVPSVFSWRCQIGEQTVQVNRGDEFVHDAPYVETETIGGSINVYCYEYSRWYGGVAINRYLTDTELANTQQWCADLADVIL